MNMNIKTFPLSFSLSFSELLAHYYVYVGLDCFPFLQKNPKIANAYNSATTATLNPSESRIEVLLLMELISWTYE